MNRWLLTAALLAIGAFPVHGKAAEGGVFRPKPESAPPDMTEWGSFSTRSSYKPSEEQLKKNEKPPIIVKKIDVEKGFPMPAKDVVSLITSQVGSRYESDKVDYDMDLVSEKFSFPQRLHVQCWYSQNGKSVTLIFGLHTAPPPIEPREEIKLRLFQ